MKKLFFVITLFVFLFTGKLYAQVLETEDSWPLLPGQFELGAGLEYQTSKEGHESALPLSIEYGLSKRFTLLVEPVPFTTIRPKVGRHVTGLGDLEMTLFYQVLKETKSRPAISLSAEIKLPTAKDTLIGTRKTDFTPFLIATKVTGKFFTSANLSYSFLGKPPGVNVNNLLNYALGTVFTASEKHIVFGEVYGNTSAMGGKDVAEGTVTGPKNTTEISGGELVGAIGYGYYVNENLLLSFGVSYDNNHAILFRPGITWTSQAGRKFRDKHKDVISN